MQPKWLESKKQKWAYRLMVGLIGSVIGGVIGGVILGLILGLRIGLMPGVMTGLKVGLIGSLIGGPIVGLILGLTIGPDSEIKTVETFNVAMSHTAWQKIFKGLQQGLTVGIMGGLMVGGIGGVIGDLIFCLIAGLTVGVISGLIFCPIAGLKADFQIRDRPNQGILAAVVNIPLISLFSYPGTVTMYLLPYYFTGQKIILAESLIAGLAFALIFGFSLGGGIVAVQHFTLRFILTLTGKTPWHYSRFLNYCVERRLLQRIGGRYRFLHRELLDHFATTNEVILVR
ncbi:MAG: hypothetical protein F6K19_47660 [Cyanothece sp. SIO1E1]|nr:hypothetical protein [Cyanothece sp. SIO1E1]